MCRKFFKYKTFLILFVLISFYQSATADNADSIILNADNISAYKGNLVKKNISLGERDVNAWVFSPKAEDGAIATFAFPKTECKGVKIEIKVASLQKPTVKNAEDVFRATLFQIENSKEVNKIRGVPVRSKIPENASDIRVVELESCYTPLKSLPIKIKIERKAEDCSDTSDSPTALLSINIIPVKALAEPTIVEDRKGYNSWPMMQSIGGKLVCTYSRGSAHVISEGSRDAYARVSNDGGKTWSMETIVSADANYGEVPIGKGLDENGDMLLWLRFIGKDRIHKLFKTKDGVNFTLLAQPKLDVMPMQITDVIHVPNVGMMSIWFTGNYGKQALNAWGTLVSKDNGKTWVQTVVESGLKNIDWNTEQSAVYLGDGKILAIARVEHSSDTTERAQFQLESRDYGKTWTRKRTNIGDIYISTPSLIFDKRTGLIYNYYYQRGRGMLKRRVVHIDKIFGNPLAWPNPEIVAFASAIGYDAGNVNATTIGDKHYLAYYSGDSKNASVVVSQADLIDGDGKDR